MVGVELVRSLFEEWEGNSGGVVADMWWNCGCVMAEMSNVSAACATELKATINCGGVDLVLGCTSKRADRVSVELTLKALV
ncbi:hypothetical protein K7X08_001087 [Anisodus acutangulus]|uniref:Uncharacterized protein n=1 Tax=Anisodus acutangulus TaxID=402998 RepID=A0A9Q1MN25_9SOLA|nr:hypothetical protein K7X08_001087 [Anisodus acutangulus]